MSNLKRLLTGSLAGGLSIEGGMRSPSIVSVEVRREAIGSMSRGGIGTSVGPLAKQCLDEAFSFSIGSGAVGSSAQVTEMKVFADVSEAVRDVAGAVVGHDGLDPDTLAQEPGNGSFEEGGRRGGSLIGHYLSVSQTRSVIDGDVDELPADAADTSGAVTVDTMSHASDAAEFLDVDVDELSRMVSLIAHDGFFGIEVFESGDPVASQDAVDCGGRESDASSDLSGGIASTPQAQNLLHPIGMGFARHAMRSRAAIDQRRLPGLSIPPSPLRSSLATQTGRLGSAGQRPEAVDWPGNFGHSCEAPSGFLR